MSPLRQQMIRELELRRMSKHTIKAYVAAIAELAQHYGCSPDRITVEEIRDWLHHLITERKLAFSSCNQRLAAYRFFYEQVLQQDRLNLRVPAKRSRRLPQPHSRSEVARLIQATCNIKHRTLLMTAYGTGGRRASFRRSPQAEARCRTVSHAVGDHPLSYGVHGRSRRALPAVFFDTLPVSQLSQSPLSQMSSSSFGPVAAGAAA